MSIIFEQKCGYVSWRLLAQTVIACDFNEFSEYYGECLVDARNGREKSTKIGLRLQRIITSRYGTSNKMEVFIIIVPLTTQRFYHLSEVNLSSISLCGSVYTSLWVWNEYAFPLCLNLLCTCLCISDQCVFPLCVRSIYMSVRAVHHCYLLVQYIFPTGSKWGFNIQPHAAWLRKFTLTCMPYKTWIFNYSPLSAWNTVNKTLLFF